MVFTSLKHNAPVRREKQPPVQSRTLQRPVDQLGGRLNFCSFSWEIRARHGVTVLEVIGRYFSINS